MKKSVNNPMFFQPNLTINKPGDIYEQEANAVAEKVMRIPALADTSFFQPASPAITPVQRKCDACGEEEKLQLDEEGEEPTPIKSGGNDSVQKKCSRCEEEEQI